MGVQMHGGHGYMDEYPISRQYTDAKISNIYVSVFIAENGYLNAECIRLDGAIRMQPC